VDAAAECRLEQGSGQRALQNLRYSVRHGESRVQLVERCAPAAPVDGAGQGPAAGAADGTGEIEAGDLALLHADIRLARKVPGQFGERTAACLERHLATAGAGDALQVERIAQRRQHVDPLERPLQPRVDAKGRRGDAEAALEPAPVDIGAPQRDFEAAALQENPTRQGIEPEPADPRRVRGKPKIEIGVREHPRRDLVAAPAALAAARENEGLDERRQIQRFGGECP